MLGDALSSDGQPGCQVRRGGRTSGGELGKDRALQLAILKATIDTWQSAYTKAHGLGAIDRDGWTKTVAFMTGLPDHPVARQVSVDELVSEALLPK